MVFFQKSETNFKLLKRIEFNSKHIYVDVLFLPRGQSRAFARQMR